MTTTLACLAGLTLVVVLCTLAEAKIGVYQAVELYIRSVFVRVSVGGWRVPVLPGGALVGAVLLLNLAAAQTRLERTWRKAGLWMAHLGLIVLFGGEFVNAIARHETRMALGPGEALNYSEDQRHAELALVDETDPAQDRVYSISEDVLKRRGAVGGPDLPLFVRVHHYSTQYQDESLAQAEADVDASEGPLSAAGGRWVLSLRDEGVRFNAGGKRYRLSLRRKRRCLPVSLMLQEFRKEVYPGTDIPRSFSSRVLVTENGGRPPRPAEISMNNPLHAAGLTFYQSGFTPDERVTILEVVDNPAWSLPYISCFLVSLGLALHFFRRLSQAAVLRS